MRLGRDEAERLGRRLQELAAALLYLALEMTASRLARTVSAFRAAAGTRIRSAHQRTFSSTPTGDGMVHLCVCLPAEDAALVTAALEAAARRGAIGREAGPEPGSAAGASAPGSTLPRERPSPIPTTGNTCCAPAPATPRATDRSKPPPRNASRAPPA